MVKMNQLKRYRGLIVASFALAAVMAVFVYEGFALYAKTVAYAVRLERLGI